ncbi:MAG: hypothetical protein C4523_12475 [Myxococcales bacterium]|nr:MAG: hypothetical protein C4523_12475 [Myxococcales bacterium]
MTRVACFSLTLFFASLLALGGCRSAAPDPDYVGEDAHAVAPKPASPPAAADPPRGFGGSRSTHEFMPLNLGNTWEYKKTFLGETGTLRVTVERKDEEGFFIDSQGGKLKHTSMGLRDENRFLLLEPVETGRKWSARVAVTVVEHFEVVEDNATIETPAGAFEHCAVVRSTTALTPEARMINEVAYAPGVGMVRTRTSIENNKKRQKDQATLELVSYTLP